VFTRLKEDNGQIRLVSHLALYVGVEIWVIMKTINFRLNGQIGLVF
jgi:hypothetical protein